VIHCLRERPTFLESQESEANTEEVKSHHSKDISKDVSEWMRNEPEEDSTAIDILGKLCKESTEEEHHIVEWVEAMPES